MLIALISFIAFLAVNFLGKRALEVLLLSAIPGNANIVLYYNIGCHIITLALALPTFLAINRTPLSELGPLFRINKKLTSLELAGAAALLIALCAAPVLIMRVLTPGFALSPPDIVDGIWLVLITPLVEEIIFRGVMLNRLKKYGFAAAVLITSALFAIGHLNIANMLVSFLPGIVLALVAYRTDSIAYTVPMHMMVNLCGSVVLPVVLGGV